MSSLEVEELEVGGVDALQAGCRRPYGRRRRSRRSSARRRCPSSHAVAQRQRDRLLAQPAARRRPLAVPAAARTVRRPTLSSASVDRGSVAPSARQPAVDERARSGTPRRCSAWSRWLARLERTRPYVVKARKAASPRAPSVKISRMRRRSPSGPGRRGNSAEPASPVRRSIGLRRELGSLVGDLRPGVGEGCSGRR